MTEGVKLQRFAVRGGLDPAFVQISFQSRRTIFQFTVIITVKKLTDTVAVFAAFLLQGR